MLETEGSKPEEMLDDGGADNEEKPLIITEDLQRDDRLRRFALDMTQEDKDNMLCDEVFALYLRHVCKMVNESYYRTVLRFVLLFRECLNEYGWLKRRDHYQKAFLGIPGPLTGSLDDHDAVLSKLKQEEKREEEEHERIAAIRSRIKRASKKRGEVRFEGEAPPTDAQEITEKPAQ